MNKIKVGYQRYVDKQDSKVAPMDIYEVFRRMEESPQLEKLTKAVRVATTKDERSQAKLKLPAIIVSAETTCRKVSPDDKRTGLIFIDLDLSDNPDTDLEKVVDSMDYSWLIGTFVSPSGGLKVLCAIEPSVDTHTRSFSALEKVFTEHGLNIDRSCKDRKRLTYICHDPDIERTLTTPLNEWKGKPILPAPEVKKKKYTPTPSS